MCVAGNHFCEYAGFECDYSRYPAAPAAAAFIRHYLAAGGDDGGGDGDAVSPCAGHPAPCTRHLTGACAACL